MASGNKRLTQMKVSNGDGTVNVVDIVTSEQMNEDISSVKEEINKVKKEIEKDYKEADAKIEEDYKEADDIIKNNVYGSVVQNVFAYRGYGNSAYSINDYAKTNNVGWYIMNNPIHTVKDLPYTRMENENIILEVRGYVYKSAITKGVTKQTLHYLTQNITIERDYDGTSFSEWRELSTMPKGATNIFNIIAPTSDNVDELISYASETGEVKPSGLKPSDISNTISNVNKIINTKQNEWVVDTNNDSTGNVYTVTLNPAPDALYNGMCITIIPNITSTSTMPSLTVNLSNGTKVTKVIKRKQTSYSNYVNGHYNANSLVEGYPVKLIYSSKLDIWINMSDIQPRWSDIYNIPHASTSTTGIVHLTDSIVSTSTSTAATANSVKQINDIKQNNWIANTFTTNGGTTGVNYAVTLNPAPTELYKGMNITIIPHTNAVNDNVKLNVNGLGDMEIRRRDSSGMIDTPYITKEHILKGEPINLRYNGWCWLLTDSIETYWYDIAGIPDNISNLSEWDNIITKTYLTASLSSSPINLDYYKDKSGVYEITGYVTNMPDTVSGFGSQSKHILIVHHFTNNYCLQMYSNPGDPMFIRYYKSTGFTKWSALMTGQPIANGGVNTPLNIICSSTEPENPTDGTIWFQISE